jgi:GNAT superfamily N-acetyltransferase
MANAEIVAVGPGELPLIVELYNEVFRPPRDLEFFRRRLAGRQNALLLVANVDQGPVGFSTAIELKHNVFFSWLTGVLPDFRRAGVATQLHEAEVAWAADHGYQYLRMECHNGHRPIIHLAIKMGFDIVGVRWDSDRAENLIIFEMNLAE